MIDQSIKPEGELGQREARQVLGLALRAAALVLALATLVSLGIAGAMQKQAANESLRRKAATVAHSLRRALDAEGRALTLQATNAAQASVVRAVLSSPDLDRETIEDALVEQMMEYGVALFRAELLDGTVVAERAPEGAGAHFFADAHTPLVLTRTESALYLAASVPVELRVGHSALLTVAQRFEPQLQLVGDADTTFAAASSPDVGPCDAVLGLPVAWPPPTQLRCEVPYEDLARGEGRLLATFSLRDDWLRLGSMLAWMAALLGLGIAAALVLLRFTLPRWALARHRFIDAQRREAESLAEAKTRFLETMSHEIRTPMNGIIGMLDLLGGTTLNVRQRRYTQTMQRSAHGLLSVLNDILDFSKLDAGKLQPRLERCELRAIAEDVLELLAVTAHGKGVELIGRTGATVPQAVRCDGERIKQVLVNLIGNAIKFTERGTVTLHIELAEDRGAIARLRCAVRDTGLGIASEDQAKLFQLFSQVDGSRTRKHGGTGLGLAICKRLVEAMGGEIGVVSAAGSGSTFWFELPVEVVLPAPRKPEAPRTGSALLATRTRELGDALVEALDDTGLSCTATTSAREAAELLAGDSAARFDLVLIDGDLDDARTPLDYCVLEDLPVLFLPSSVQGGPDDEPGVARVCLPKPVRSHDLVRAAFALLERKPFTASTLQRVISHRPVATPRGHIVMVVDDNEVNRIIAAELLGELGYEALLASSGDEALAKSEAHEVAVIFMDCEMPDMDGYEATQRLRAAARTASTPIIALTAHRGADVRARALAAGMNDFIEKPIRAQALAGALARWLRADPHAPPPSATAEHAAADAAPSNEAVLESQWPRSVLVVDTFVRAVPEQLSALESAAHSGNVERTRRMAHLLKGSCVSIGASQLARSCRMVEDAAREGRILAAVLEDMPAQLDVVMGRLRLGEPGGRHP